MITADPNRSTVFQIRQLARCQHLLLLGMILLAFGLRLYHLDSQSFWSDEGLSVHYASAPVGELLARIRTGFHNPLYFLGLHFWMGLFGSTDWAIRLFSLIPSLLAVPLLYALGRTLYGSTLGVFAALLLAVNPFAIYYAQEARMYAMVLALGLAVSLSFLTALRVGSIPAWVAFTFCSAAALYTHYFAALAPLATAAYFIFSYIRGQYRQRTVPWLISQVATATLYTPWLPSALSVTSADSWQEVIPPLSLVLRAFQSFVLGETFPFASRALITAGFGLLFILGCVALYFLSHAHAHQRDTLFAPIMLLVPIVIVAALAATGRGILIKYLTAVLPAILLFLAAGLLVWRRIAWPLTGLGLILILTVDGHALQTYYFDKRYWRPDYRLTATYITKHEHPGDLILADGFNPDIVFKRYYPGQAPIYRVDLGEAVEENKLLSELIARTTRAWLILNFHQPGRIEHWMESHGFQIDSNEFSTIRLYLYHFPTALPSDVVPVPRQQAAGPVRLAGYRLFPNPVTSDCPANLSLVWETETPPGINYKVSIRLTDATGRVIWSRDRSPIEGIVPSANWLPHKPITDNVGIPVPLGTIPGEYPVNIVLYDPSSAKETVTSTLGPLRVNRPEVPPPIELLSRTQRRPVPFGNCQELLDYEVSSNLVRAGDSLDIYLRWRAVRAPAPDADAVFQFRDRQNRITSEQRLAHTSYPLSSWAEGEIVRFPYTLKVDPALPTGQYRLAVNLVDARTGQFLRSEPLLLANIDVTARPRMYTPPRQIGHTVDVRVGESIRLLGYDFSATKTEPGKPLAITLYWQSLAPMPANYTVFVHLLDATGQLVAGADSPPLRGEAPTTSWLTGECLIDRHELLVPLDAPPGNYRIEVGMYNPADGVRLPLRRSGQPLPDDRFLLNEIVSVEK